MIRRRQVVLLVLLLTLAAAAPLAGRPLPGAAAGRLLLSAGAPPGAPKPGVKPVTSGGLPQRPRTLP